MNRREAAVAELEARIGHVFHDRELLERALTHASVGEGAPTAASSPATASGSTRGEGPASVSRPRCMNRAPSRPAAGLTAHVGRGGGVRRRRW